MSIEEQLEVLLKELEGKEKITAEQTTRMFNIYNTLYPKSPEYTKSCGGCRSRVYKKLKSYTNGK
jgi:hypothetical protein